MKERLQRTALLMGEDALRRLQAARVAVFGLGGVGGYAVEALARGGIGALDLIDHDTVSESNLNRQILATVDTVGRLKVDAAKQRIASVNPDCTVTTYEIFVLPETIAAFDFSVYDYVIDAIDTISGKLAIIEAVKKVDVPIISCMGTGNKMDPMAFEVADLYDTSVCPLAKVMRKECKARGIAHVKVVYSKETPIKTGEIASEEKEADLAECIGRRRAVPGSNSFTPAAAGLLLASQVIKDIIGYQ